jgi:hypothetical protein
MENHAPLVVGEDAFVFSASLGIEGYAHRAIFELFRETGAGRLEFLREEADQKAGRDYRYHLGVAGEARRITFECKAELYPWNHFYELMLFYARAGDTGEYEYGNAQKTTAHLMLYVNYVAGYVVLAQRVTWLHVAQELVLNDISGNNAKPLFAALNGKTRFELAGVGRQFPHATVAQHMLELARTRQWPYLPFAVFDLREAFSEDWLSRDVAKASGARRQYARDLMLLKYPSYAKAGNEAKLEKATSDFLGRMGDGQQDFRQMNELLGQHGGIRPAAELAGWVESLPGFSARHELPVQRFGKKFLGVALKSDIVTNQAQRLVDDFNRCTFRPYTDLSAEYFHGMQNRDDVPGLKFRVRRK